jgi:hypothetical protein
LGFRPHAPEIPADGEGQGWADRVRRRARSAHHFRPAGGLVCPAQLPRTALQPGISGGLSQRFAERDGMVFLPEQVSEYDKKRMQTAKAPQMEMFIADERSAIDWLSDFLKKKPSTYQEIHPEFIKQLGAGWKKHEAKPELSYLLESNFLCYDPKDKDGVEVPSQIHSYLSTNWQELPQSGEVRPTPESQGD